MLGVPVHEIVDKVKRGGLIGWLRSGYQASKAMATPIEDPVKDLAGLRHLVLVQPLWADSVCPPLRSWLRGRKDELAGLKLSLLTSNFGSPGDTLRARFEAEFGPLTVFKVISQKTPGPEREAALASFAAAIQGRC